MTIRSSVAAAIIVLVVASLSWAQGEYVGFGQSAVGFGMGRAVGKYNEGTTLAGGGVFNGKYELSLSFTHFDSKGSLGDAFGARYRSFLKRDLERQTVFACYEVDMAATGETVFISGGVGGFVNLWIGGGSCFQLSAVQSLAISARSSRNNGRLSAHVMGGLAYVQPLGKGVALAFESGVSGSTMEGSGATGAVGLSIVIPLKGKESF